MMINPEVERRNIAIKVFGKLLNQKSNVKNLVDQSVDIATVLQAKLDATNICPHRGKVVHTAVGARCFDCGAFV